jgi:hypothetical protein
MGRLGDDTSSDATRPPLDSTVDLVTALPGKHRIHSGKPYKKGLKVSEWLSLVEEYQEGRFKSKMEFLRSKGLTGESHRKTFNRRLRQHADGELQKTQNNQRIRPSLYSCVEDKIVEYINLRNSLMKTDKCGLSFSILRSKAIEFASKLDAYESFTASAGWLAEVLKRHKLTQLNLQGEAGDIDPEERATVMAEFKGKLASLMDEFGVTTDRIYNADQTGVVIYE